MDMRYRIIWEIDVEAADAVSAARAAFEMMQKPDTTAPVFDVVSENGVPERVDLLAD